MVDPIDTAALEALGPPVRRLVRKGHPVPRLFTPGLIARSADSFPIEFLDIGGGRIVLHGEDPFAAVTIDREALRLQLERELKEKIMLLREAYVMVHGSPAGLRRLLTESYPAFAALFRGGLHLLGRPIPARSTEVVAAFCGAAGLERSPFDEIARLRRGERPGAAPRAIFARYHDALERAADAVDRLISRGGEAR